MQKINSFVMFTILRMCEAVKRLAGSVEHARNVREIMGQIHHLTKMLNASTPDTKQQYFNDYIVYMRNICPTDVNLVIKDFEENGMADLRHS